MRRTYAWLALVAACSGGEGDGASSSGSIDVPLDAGASIDASALGAHTIGGTVAGLVGVVELEEKTSGAIVRIISDRTFAFPTRLAEGGTYAVVVRTQPRGQTCVVVDGSGTVGGDVTNVVVSCGHDLHRVGGTVVNVSGSVVLANNGTDRVVKAADGPFAFPTPLPVGTPYAVTVAEQPVEQHCTIENAAGKVSFSPVDDVIVTCKAARAIGGAVSGLLRGTVALQLNREGGSGTVFVESNGAFTFARRIPPGENYTVTVFRSPPGQTCVVTSGGSGTADALDVTNVVVSCRKLVVAVDEVNARIATGAYGDANGDSVRDSGDEFVEVVNGESFAVEIGGWTVRTGTPAPVTRFTFPPGTTLPPGGRAVVFGGGKPTGSFGGAAVFTAALGLTDAPAEPFTVELASTNGFRVDALVYDGTSFPACSTACASLARAGGPGGTFAAHTTLSGSPGILWSPGVAPEAAIPKLVAGFSVPGPTAASAPVDAPIRIQLNMFMNPSDFVDPKVRLFASPCAALANPVGPFAALGIGVDASQARLVPASPLAYGTTYCVSLAGTMRSANDTPLAASTGYEFTTRAAVSMRAASVVISEIGGCRFSTTSATTACGGTGSNDEFVELYNPTNAAVSVAGFHLQRRSTTGGATCFATLPAGASIPAFGHYLVGGAGYTASRYTGAPAADHLETTNGTALSGANETVVLASSALATCVTVPPASEIVDAVSVGSITTDALTAILPLPALDAAIANGRSIERKACFQSTAAGMEGGAHAGAGNAERSGSTHSDFVARTKPGPQNSAAAKETPTCP